MARITEEDYQDILSIFEDAEEPALSAKRVAERFNENVQYQKMAYHLDKLVEEGELVRDKFGPSVVYWLAD